MNEESHIKQIKEATGELWAGYIQNFHCDFLHHTLTFDVIIYEDDEIHCHYVTIEGITEIAYYNDSYKGDGSKNPRNEFSMEIVEFSSFSYMTSKISASRLSIGDQIPYKNTIIEDNICIEIWYGALYIKAKKLTINDKNFILR